MGCRGWSTRWRKRVPRGRTLRPSTDLGWIGERNLRRGSLRVSGPHRHRRPTRGHNTALQRHSHAARDDRAALARSMPGCARRGAASGLPSASRANCFPSSQSTTAGLSKVTSSNFIRDTKPPRKSYVPRPKLDSVAVRQLLRLVEMFGAHECSSTPQGERRDAPARR